MPLGFESNKVRWRRIKVMCLLFSITYLFSCNAINIPGGIPTCLYSHLFSSCHKQNFHALEGFDSTALKLQKECVQTF